MSKAVVFFANGTEECEALLVVDLLRRAGVEVVTAGVGGDTVLSSHKISLKADAKAEEIDYSTVDLVVLPGGVPGTPNLAASPVVEQACKQLAAAGKKVAAICAAPSALAGFGLLEGKPATVHPAFEDKMCGATVTHESVTVSGNLTTGQGLGAGIPFALELVRQLVSEAEAERIAKAICWHG